MGHRRATPCIDFPVPTDSIQLMASINVERRWKPKRMVVEIDAGRLERLAASLDLLSPSFLNSISRSEEEIALGKTKRLRNLRQLRRQ